MPLDPRSKLLALGLSLVVVAATPLDRHHALLAYSLLTIGLAMILRVSPSTAVRRALTAMPLLMLAAIAWKFSQGVPWTAAAALFVRGCVVIGVGALLTVSTALPELIWGIRRLGFPPVLATIILLTFRYVHLLQQDWRDSTRARQSRAPVLTLARTEIYGKQLAMVFVRSWERAERIHNAMMARGFSGELPLRAHPEFGVRDGLFAFLVPAAYLTIALMA